MTLDGLEYKFKGLGGHEVKLNLLSGLIRVQL